MPCGLTFMHDTSTRGTLRSHVQASGRSSKVVSTRCAALFTALVSGQGGRQSRVSVTNRLGRSPGLVAAADWVVSFAGAESDEARPPISSGSQQPTGANAVDVAERIWLLTVRDKVRAVRDGGREASSDRGTRTGASHVRVAFRGTDSRGWMTGSAPWVGVLVPRTVRGDRREASSDRGTRSGASHVRVAFRRTDWRGWVSGSALIEMAFA